MMVRSTWADVAGGMGVLAHPEFLVLFISQFSFCSPVEKKGPIGMFIPIVLVLRSSTPRESRPHRQEHNLPLRPPHPRGRVGDEHSPAGRLGPRPLDAFPWQLALCYPTLTPSAVAALLPLLPNGPPPSSDPPSRARPLLRHPPVYAFPRSSCQPLLDRFFLCILQVFSRLPQIQEILVGYVNANCPYSLCYC
jgi:hypothetical protein